MSRSGLLLRTVLVVVLLGRSSVAAMPSRTRRSPRPYDGTAAMALPPPLERVKQDYLALTRRVTARHILLPKSRDAALALKQKIRGRVCYGRNDENENDDTLYVEDAFAAAAARYSRDAETAARGGLLGTTVPPGYCRSPELDRACFEVPLGEVYGPIESTYGYHLLLVTERTNCPRLDGAYTRIVRGGPQNKEAVFAGPPEGSETLGEQTMKGVVGQLAFWVAASLAGGVVAELAANAAGVLESLPWQSPPL